MTFGLMVGGESSVLILMTLRFCRPFLYYRLKSAASRIVTNQFLVGIMGKKEFVEMLNFYTRSNRLLHLREKISIAINASYVARIVDKRETSGGLD